MPPSFIRRVGTRIRPTWHSQAVRDYPGRFAIMGSLPLDQPESRARIAAWRDQPGMLGLRYTFLHDPARQWLHGWHHRLAVGGGRKSRRSHRHAGDRFADRYRPASPNAIPGLRLTIDHLGGRGGLTTLKDAAAMTHIPAASGAGEIPQRGGEGDRRAGLFQPRPIRSPRCRPICARSTTRSVRTACSGAPTSSKMPCSWRQCVTMFTEELPWLSDQDKRLIMGDALCAWWGWNRAA